PARCQRPPAPGGPDQAPRESQAGPNTEGPKGKDEEQKEQAEDGTARSQQSVTVNHGRQATRQPQQTGRARRAETTKSLRFDGGGGEYLIMWMSMTQSLAGRCRSVALFLHRHTNTPTPAIISGLPCNSSPLNETTRRHMSKYLSKSATKRLPLNTKRAKKGYYKGKGCTSEGRLTSKGKFIADPLKKLNLIVPDLEGFTLKPYIARTVDKRPPEMRPQMVS
ncbi:hypothetical protein THAOC_18594, partial [Thalassiosira oceanica]